MSRFGFLVVLSAGCVWEAPVMEAEEAPTNVISGTVVVNASAVSGPTLVLLYDANDPPPPEGTGKPVNLAAIPASSFSGGAGVQTAPFALTGVPDGTWLVTALQDHDEDFHPLIDATAGATCGDMLGAYLSDISTGDIGTVSVSGGQLADGVTVAVGSVMPLERPAFVFAAEDSDTSITRDGTDPNFALSSTDVASTDGAGWDILTLTGPMDVESAYSGGAYDPCDVAFAIYIPDDDGAGDGNPHPNAAYAAEGFIEAWPRVYLRYLGDGNVQLEEGESYSAEALWASQVDALTAIARFGYTWEQVLSSVGLGFNMVAPVLDLELYLPPVALHTEADGTETVVMGSDMPGGSWAVTVVSITGQTWTVPNALASLGSASPTFDETLQAGVLSVE